MAASPSAPSTSTCNWQDTIRLRLVERDAQQRSYEGIISQYRRLAQQALLLKEQNQTLLRAGARAGSGKPGEGGADNPLQAALVSSLQSQLHSARDELTLLYKTQSQSSQRLLTMNETLRERDELVRAQDGELGALRTQVERLQRKHEEDREGRREREKGIQAIEDELEMTRLELAQMEQRNLGLRNDNAALLQRWLDLKNEEAERMNDANRFYEELARRGRPSMDGGSRAGDTETDLDGFSTDGEKVEALSVSGAGSDAGK